MKKEDIISKAYGIYWDKLSDKFKLAIIKNNGWLNFGETELASDKKISIDIISNLKIHPKNGSLNEVRPKDLYGIEYNFGWITLTNKDDLPTNDSECWFIMKDESKIRKGKFKDGIFSFNTGFSGWGNITHYIEIKEPITIPYEEYED